MCFWLSPCYQYLLSAKSSMENFEQTVSFNGRDSHDVITYNCANYVCKSMVDKNRTYK